METTSRSKLSRASAKRLVRVRRGARKLTGAFTRSPLTPGLVLAVLFLGAVGASEYTRTTSPAATDQSVATLPADNSGSALEASSGSDPATPSVVAAAEPPQATSEVTASTAQAPAPEAAVVPRKAEPAPVVPAVAPTFRDERALVPAVAAPVPSFSVGPTPVTAAPAEPPPPAVLPDFKDLRPLVRPSFVDKRPVAAPSFRDDRPVADAPAPAPAPPVAAKEEPSEPKPFEVGYFLEDRSPMVRQLQTETEPVKEASADKAPGPSAPEPAAVPASSEPAADTSLPTLVALAPGQLKVDGAACTAPEVSTEPLDGGMMRIRIAASCYPNEFVQISYGGAEFIRKLNSYGALDYTLDCFAGTSSAVELRFANGSTKSLPVVANDLDKVSKIAVTWRSGVNLDLHVFEYAAAFNGTGHFWAKSPSTLGAARLQSQSQGRGHGFLSSLDDDKSLGDKLEVYTFFHNDQQSTGAISLALDNETRGEVASGAACGQGALAEVDFQVSILPRNGKPSRQSGVLTRVECGAKLTQEARFNSSAMPGLRIRK